MNNEDSDKVCKNDFENQEVKIPIETLSQKCHGEKNYDMIW